MLSPLRDFRGSANLRMERCCPVVLLHLLVELTLALFFCAGADCRASIYACFDESREKHSRFFNACMRRAAPRFFTSYTEIHAYSAFVSQFQNFPLPCFARKASARQSRIGGNIPRHSLNHAFLHSRSLGRHRN